MKIYKNYLVGDFLLFDWDPKFWFNETDTEVKVEEVSTFICDVVGMLTTFCCNFLVATGFNELKNIKLRKDSFKNFYLNQFYLKNCSNPFRFKFYLSGVRLCGGVVATEPGFDLSLKP